MRLLRKTWNLAKITEVITFQRSFRFTNLKTKQDGPLAPAYFSPNYKYFDQLCKRLKTKQLFWYVFKEFLQTPIRPLISVLYAKGYHDFPLKKFCLTVTKNFVEEPFCVWKILVSKNVRDKRGGGYHDFLSKLFCLTVPKNFVGEPFCVKQKFEYRKNLWIGGGGEGWGREYHNFPSKIFGLTVPKNFVGINSMFQKIWGIEKFYA